MKTVKRDGYRVVVTPSTYGGENHQKMLAACKTLAQSIKRHVDDIDEVDCDFDETEVCSFCGEKWDVYASGMPGCCDEAQQEWVADRTVCGDCDGTGTNSESLTCETCDGTGLKPKTS